MEHWVHQRIKELIQQGAKSRAEIAYKLEIGERTLIRRLQDGSWTLHEILAIEELYGAPVLMMGAKYGMSAAEGNVPELTHTFSEPAPYSIKIEIDPMRFKPEDLESLNKTLAERMKGWYSITKWKN